MTTFINIICNVYGANIEAPRTINNIPIKNTVLFATIKIEII